MKYFGRTDSRKADGLCTRMTSPGSSHPTDSHGASFSMSSNSRTGKFMRESEEMAGVGASGGVRERQGASGEEGERDRGTEGEKCNRHIHGRKLWTVRYKFGD